MELIFYKVALILIFSSCKKMYLSPPILRISSWKFYPIEKNMREEWYDDDTIDKFYITIRYSYPNEAYNRCKQQIEQRNWTRPLPVSVWLNRNGS